MRINKSSYKKILNLLLFSSFLIYILSLKSCANTSAPPSGGPKDTIPPIIEYMEPDSNAINVIRHKTKLEFKFNEYVVIKDANTNIYLSPPQKKKPELKIKGKSVIVTFKEDLDSAQCYNLNFGNAIVDNNEGNILVNFSYPFSTGNIIDSMMCTGIVRDSRTLFPEEHITIAFYKEHQDSILYKTLPDAITKSDKWGYFIARNLEPVNYSVFAFKDENADSRYDPYTERTAFIDSLFKPTMVMKKDNPELAYFDIKDTIGCLARPTELELKTFIEISPRQFIRSNERPDIRYMYVKFAAPYVQIDSLWFDDYDSTKIIKEFNITQDSLSIWINDQALVKDTLFMGLKFWHTDTLDQLVPIYDTLRFLTPLELRKKEEPKNKKFEEKDPNAIREDLLTFELNAEPDQVEQYGIQMEFKAPLIKADIDSISFKYLTPRKQEGIMEFSVEKDSTNIRKYNLKPKDKFQIGNEYKLFIPGYIFKDINGFTNDTIIKDIILPTDEELSTLTIILNNVDSKYIIDLITETRDKVIRSFDIQSDTTIIFPYIKTGKYSIRMSEDENLNDLFDTGSILERKQPEKVIFYELSEDMYLIEIPERADIEQTIDIKASFN